jgi:Tol biopolymer transport system component
MSRRFLAFGFLALLAPGAAGGGQTPTIEQSLNVKTASDPRISPDGRYVAYQVREADWAENAFKSEIWIAAADTGDCYPLTHSKKSSNNPRWSPDGKRLAFLSDREGKPQIYLIAPRGGEAVALTKTEAGVNDFEWSPDGRHIAFTAADPESKARKERKEKYGDFLVVEGDYTMTHLWQVAAPAPGEKAPEPQRLTEGETFTVGGFSWSPDGKRLAFSAARDPDLGSMHTSDIYVLDPGDKSVKKVVDTSGPDTNPRWSPDGTQIAFETAAGRDFFFYANSRIAVVPAEGGKPHVLTEAFDESPRLIGWGPDGLYFSARQKTDEHLFRLDPSAGAVERVSQPDHAICSQFSLSRDFKQAAFLRGDSKQRPAKELKLRQFSIALLQLGQE